jgi:hypothetical protein
VLLYGLNKIAAPDVHAEFQRSFFEQPSVVA